MKKLLIYWMIRYKIRKDEIHTAESHLLNFGDEHQNTYIKKLANTGASTTVMSPATAIERLLMAPSVSPNSRAFAVPTACDAVPIASPTDMGFLILNSLHTFSPITFPVMPVSDMATTVMVGMPPISSDTPIPIAVVMDLGSSDAYISCVNLKNTDSTSMPTRLDSVPVRMLIIIALKFFLSESSC